jgi:hypothetical protein
MMTTIERLFHATILATFAGLAGFTFAADKPPVHVDVSKVGPRQLEQQTQASVVRDYLDAWKTLRRALEENRTDLLDTAFVGTAKEKFADTIQQQRETGVKGVYLDASHNLEFGFYSPEGMSIQVIDTVEYDVEVTDQGHSQGTQHVRTRYVAVLTPTEVRWKVRILQAEPQ